MKRIITILLFIASCGSLAAQTDSTFTDTVPTPPAPHEWPGEVHPPRVGLVLSGGGAKGSAHIGVLKYMEEIGIPISYVTGTSMGSIIGGLYAMGYTPDELADLIAHMDWSFYMSNTIERENLSIEKRERKSTELLSIPFSIDDLHTKKDDVVGSLPASAINSSNLLNLFNRLCIGYQDSMSFSDMPIPFACIATDLLSGDSMILNKGEFARAIRSSMSIPGVFAPVEWGNHLLADGGMVNNFPADVCKNMGADIIIGVEVASNPITDKESLRSLPQQIMQYLSIATQGNNVENRKKCNIYITPDVTGYNMLSFSTENIDTLVQRGYRQAQLHRDEFLALKAQLEKYGPCKKELQHPRAKKLMPGDRIQIGEVNYHGVSAAEIRQLLALQYLKPNEEIDVSELETTVSRLRGSGNYLYAHYVLHEHKRDSIEQLFGLTDTLSHYDVDFHLIPAQPHTLGIGFRYDSEESAAVLFHLGWNEQRTAGFKVFFDLDLTYNFGLNAHLSWSKTGTGAINFDYRYHMSAYRVLNWGTMQSYWNNRFRLYYSNRSFNHLTILAGLQQDLFVDADTRLWSYLLNQEENNYTEINDSEEALGLFASLNYDNMDDKYFAQHGMEFNVNGAIYKHDKHLFNKNYRPFGEVWFSWKMHIPLSSRFNLIPQVSGRALINYFTVTDAIWYNNVIGGAFDSRYFDHQLAFIGINDLYRTADQIAVGRLDLRYQMTKKIYLSLLTNAFYAPYLQTDEEGNSQLNNIAHLGLGLRIAFKSFIGPIWFDLNWSTLTHSVCAYFNVGYFF